MSVTPLHQKLPAETDIFGYLYDITAVQTGKNTSTVVAEKANNISTTQSENLV